MAEFEGKMNLNVDTSEIEIKGKFKLTEEELDTVTGGYEYQIYYACTSCKAYWKGPIVQTSCDIIGGGGFGLLESLSTMLCPNCGDRRTEKYTGVSDVFEFSKLPQLNEQGYFLYEPS